MLDGCLCVLPLYLFMCICVTPNKELGGIKKKDLCKKGMLESVTGLP